MTGNLLTISSSIMCPHGGQAILSTSNTKVLAGSSAVLLESDVHPIVGCPFTVSLKYSPCVRIEWSLGSKSIQVNGTRPLVQGSIGKCIGAEGAPQGVAIIIRTQAKAVGL